MHVCNAPEARDQVSSGSVNRLRVAPEQGLPEEDDMTLIFGPHGQRVLALISCISGLHVREVDQVTSAWNRGDAYDRARAWAQLNQAASECERYRILAVAALARREAMETARRMRRTDWAFWAAACDAGAAIAAGARIGRHYDTLIAPFAEVIPALARGPIQLPGSEAASAASHEAEPELPAKSA
jgi:hypothetical protein